MPASPNAAKLADSQRGAGTGTVKLAALLLGLLLGVAAPPVHGQTLPDDEPPPEEATRQGRLRRQRLQKKENLVPPGQGFLSKTIGRVESFIERNQIVIDLPALDLYGLRPVLGGLRAGAGTTGGLRLPFLETWRDRFAFVEVLGSLNWYYGANFAAGFDDAGPWTAYGFGRYWHMPEEDFYGVGPDTGDHRSNYRLNESIIGGLVGYELLPRVLVGGHVSYQTNRYGEGQDESFPTVERATFEAEVPGQGADVDYAVPGTFIEYDTRNIPYDVAYGRRFSPTEERLRGISLDATSGFYAAAEAIPHLAVGRGHYSYVRFNFEGQQYVPFREGYQVLALRQFLTLASTPGRNQVPFYQMETLGGSRTIRGFRNFRFRDRNAILFNAEYRWQIFRPLDLALFADAGHVFDSAEELTLGAEDFEFGYGIGFRIKSGRRVIGRVDVAHSREGLSVDLRLGGLL